MENFVVSARKYRPKNFDAVIGQSHITTTLKNAIKNKQLAHAFLFCGPRGVGKTTCARILAKTINCENQTAEGEACNECTSCKDFQDGRSLNIHELDAASNNSVDNIRELTDQVRFAPQAGKYKVYIIDEVHMLSAAAFNAFLKTLEEPPPYAIFILATTEKHKILPTILSRCQVFDFKRMSAAETVDHLKDICKKEKVDTDSDALHLIAQKSDGCMRDALSILDKIISFTGGRLTYKNTLEHLNILDYDYFFKICESILQQDAGAALLIYDEILQKGFEGDDFIDGYCAFLRDLLVSKDHRVVHLMEVSENLKERYKELSTKMETGFLISALNILNETGIQYKQARNKRLAMEMCLIRLSYLQQAVALISDERTGAVSKKKVTDRNARPAPLRNPFRQKALHSGRKGITEKKETEKVLVTPSQPKRSSSPDKPNMPIKGTENPPGEKSHTAESAHTDLFNKTKKLDLRSFRSKVEREKEKTGRHNEAPVRPLEDAPLQEIWKQHIVKLKKRDKNQAAGIMNLATIRIVSDEEVEIVCRNPVQKSFIDDQKFELADELKAFFRNNVLQVTVKIDDSLRRRSDEKEVLTQRQKLEKMMEKYPLVRELKEGLNLDLG